MATEQQPRIGVSACLLGEPVRFDGGHKKNRLVIDTCSRMFDLQPLCPEAELGLGVPRPAIQLRHVDGQVRLVQSRPPHHDLTGAMQLFARQRIVAIGQLDGMIFKKDSPSCGPERVPVYHQASGCRERKGTGLFAGVFKQRYPLVPTEDEGRLNDAAIRENFFERVYAHYRWRHIENADHNLRAFQDFHRRYKLMLMARSPHGCRRLGRLVASTAKNNLAEIRPVYFEQFMGVMEKRPTPGQQVNVLQHILGYLKNRLNSHDKAELLTWFETYRQQQVSRITPLVLLQHHLRHHPDDYLSDQYYFSPFPPELMQPVVNITPHDYREK